MDCVEGVINSMKKYFLVTMLVLLTVPMLALAAEKFERAKVLRILETENIVIGNEASFYQKAEIELSNGNKEILSQGKDSVVTEVNKLQSGDEIVVYKSDQAGAVYEVSDRWRLGSLAYIFVIFILLVLLIVGGRGLLALLGLIYSLAMVVLVMVPMLIHGYNPVFTSLLTGLLIVVPSMFLTHGIKRQSVIASASIIGGLLVALVINILWTKWAQLNGGGSEEVYFLQVAGLGSLDFRALFMGGVIVGVLGVLDDVAIGQISVVNELRRANDSMTKAELMLRSLRVGKAHVLSLVNTLALAYVGASLPLFLLFAGDNGLPWWVMLNSEGVGEEIIRTLVGSAALVLTVPIATLLAVWFGKKNEDSIDGCKH